MVLSWVRLCVNTSTAVCDGQAFQVMAALWFCPSDAVAGLAVWQTVDGAIKDLLRVWPDCDRSGFQYQELSPGLHSVCPGAEPFKAVVIQVQGSGVITDESSCHYYTTQFTTLQFNLITSSAHVPVCCEVWHAHHCKHGVGT